MFGRIARELIGIVVLASILGGPKVWANTNSIPFTACESPHTQKLQDQVQKACGNHSFKQVSPLRVKLSGYGYERYYVGCAEFTCENTAPVCKRNQFLCHGACINYWAFCDEDSIE